MAFDLDNEELKATRKLHNQDDGLYEETSDKNVVNVEVIEDFIFELKGFGLNKDTLEVAHAVENLLTEREQNKKRIQELEEKFRHAKYLYDDCCKCLLDSIPKQKIKDKIEGLRSKVIKYKNDNKVILNNIKKKYLNGKNLKKFDSTDLIIFSLDNAYLEKISILQELLEDK